MEGGVAWPDPSLLTLTVVLCTLPSSHLGAVGIGRLGLAVAMGVVIAMKRATGAVTRAQPERK